MAAWQANICWPDSGNAACRYVTVLTLAIDAGEVPRSTPSRYTRHIGSAISPGSIEAGEVPLATYDSKAERWSRWARTRPDADQAGSMLTENTRQLFS